MIILDEKIKIRSDYRMPLDFNFIENLLGLQDIKVTSVNVNNGVVEIYGESKTHWAVCPKCNKTTYKVHDYRIQVYEHLPIWDKTTIIRLKICRYVCECDLNHPFDETFCFIRKYQPHTIPFEELIFKLTCKNTIKNVAELLGFSENKVQRIFNHYAKIKIDTKEMEPFIFLGIDDIAKSKGHSYYTVIYNHETGDVAALIDGRTKEIVVKYITENFTKEQRESVLAVSLDMSKTYAAVVLECFPNATPVTDRFHISQALHAAVDKARKHIQNKMRKEDGDKKKVFGIRWAFLKNHEDLKVEEEKLLEQVCSEYPMLRTCYELKEEFRNFFEITTIDKASVYIDCFTALVAESEIPELQSFCKTLNNWREYILNYYYFFISNGPTEGRNHKLKNIKRRGYGYRNIDNFRLRICSECA
jgi:transposase